MLTKNKYQAVKVFWDTKSSVVRTAKSLSEYKVNGNLNLPESIIRFDSQHEFKVYLELLRIYGANRIRAQVPIQIIPPCDCYPNGKNWRVDFVVSHMARSTGRQFLVEAKGVMLPEFTSILAFLELTQPVLFRKLNIIFPASVPKTNKVINALTKGGYKNNLMTLKQLQKLNQLP